MEPDIAGKDLFMVCHSPRKAAYRSLPEGYFFRRCRRDELELKRGEAIWLRPFPFSHAFLFFPNQV